MTIGMLWLYDPNNPLAQEIAKAAAYHLKKYGRAPEICMVHPSTQIDVTEMQGANGGKISVRPWGNVPPGHLWIGIEEMPTAPEETK